MKQKKLAAIHANEGVTLEFQRKLEAMIDEMANSLEYWLTAAYRANTPKTALAHDASPSAMLNEAMRRLSRKWYSKFSDAAKPLASYYALAAKDRTDGALKAALKKAGISIDFKTTAEIQGIMSAAVNQNVSLIKSIATEHLADVNQLVQRSVMAGRDLGTLRKELQERHGITKRRAQLIARQSNNDASAMFERERARELDITEATWVHSSAGREPRHEHTGWNGKTYNIQQGMWSTVSKKYVWPGTDFNCRCQKRMLIPTKHIVSASTKARAK